MLTGPSGSNYIFDEHENLNHNGSYSWNNACYIAKLQFSVSEQTPCWVILLTFYLALIMSLTRMEIYVNITHMQNHLFWHTMKVTTTLKTRRSENDNTPQPLDQWTNSPFIGQQVGNCKSFTLTHYLANLFAKHRGPRSIPLCIQHHIQLTSLSFQVSRPSHSEIKQFQYFTLKI